MPRSDLTKECIWDICGHGEFDARQNPELFLRRNGLYCGMSLFDTHFHLNPDDDLAAIAERARAAGVDRMLVAGASVGGIEQMLARIMTETEVYAAVGVHPHEAEEFDDDMEPYKEWSEHPRVRAIGEIGLDYHYDFAPRARQHDVFRAFLKLSRETGLPAVIHNRDATEDVERMLKETLAGEQSFVIHCFTETPEWVERFVALGGYISFTGIITFKAADSVRQSMKVVPRDRLMIETDSPYLAPVPFRGKVNEPAYVAHVAARIAAELEMSVDELAELTTANGRRFFGV